MTLSEIANLVYKESHHIIIDSTNYDDTIFTRSWLNEYHPLLLNKSGWYWITSTMPFNEFENLKVTEQKLKGCDIAKVAKQSKAIFDEDLLCKTHFYNGHAQKLVSRLRNHFYLQNDGTSALGLNAYHVLKKYTITVSCFSEKNIINSKFTDTQKVIIQQLITENIGRTAIENAWRADNGFPVLCKH